MTALSALLAGSRLTAAEAQGVAPLAAYKAADTSRGSTTTLANDPDLSIAVAPNAVYSVHGFLSYTGDVTGSGGLKWTWTVPSGATLVGTAFFFGTAINASGLNLTAVVGAGATDSAVTNGGVPMPVLVWGTLFTGANAGTLTLQWCQNASDATATTIKAGSSLLAWQVT